MPDPDLLDLLDINDDVLVCVTYEATYTTAQTQKRAEDEANKPGTGMKMKRCIAASILLMLALLVAGHPSVTADDVGTILLPSKGKDQVVMELPRPWKCCDVTSCTKSDPPACTCEDVVDSCAATCKLCRPLSPPRCVCLDQYTGEPGPKCTEVDVAGGGN
ncbi:hypothetical protein ZWY2020_031399 [Hordeum vulgare]|nr:hypothetical protein ZWY2020_031399 [Hordeum vulgare]